MINFCNLEKETDIQVQEAERALRKLNKRRSTSRHVIIKMDKSSNKERILKARRKRKTVTYKRNPIKLQADFQ